MSSPRRHLALMVALAFCLGASAQAVAKPEHPAPAAEKVASPALSEGMTAAEVLQIAGKPESVKPMKQEGIQAEIWRYSFTQTLNVRPVVTGTRQEPYFDLITNQQKSRTETVYGQETSTLVEVTELLMID
ncbi:MAG TPA: hypothetical protein PKJ41_20535, partial [Bryobacteraceae bacterium]|nr:hypothetical protein [Bryobacteraceae bacterium]